MEEEIDSQGDTGGHEELGFDPTELIAAAVEGRVQQEGDEDDVDPTGASVPSRLAALRSAVPRDMPKVDHLADAVELDPLGRPVFTLSPGQRVVIERRASVLNGHPWLDTQVYEIREVDQLSGLLKLWNPELRHHARDNFRVGVSVGSRYKVPPARGKWDAPPKVVITRPDAPPPQLGPDGQPVKRKRGRPPGVKNRPKDVIEQEKAVRFAERKVKKRRKVG